MNGPRVCEVIPEVELRRARVTEVGDTLRRKFRHGVGQQHVGPGVTRVNGRHVSRAVASAGFVAMISTDVVDISEPICDQSRRFAFAS